jgi:hypothetical protein
VVRAAASTEGCVLVLTRIWSGSSATIFSTSTATSCVASCPAHVTGRALNLLAGAAEHVRRGRFRQMVRRMVLAWRWRTEPERQRSYLYHFAAAKQSATQVARIEKAMSAIFEGRGLLEKG